MIMQKYSLNRQAKKTAFIIIDLISAVLAVYLSIVVRFVIDCSFFPNGAVLQIGKIMLFWLPADILIFSLFRMYDRLWEYASMLEALRIIAAAFCSFLTLVVFGSIANLDFPKSFYFIALIFLTFFALATRFFKRIVGAIQQIHATSETIRNTRNIMIIGAGHAGNALIREIEKDRSFSNFRVVCLIDDDLEKKDRYLGCAKIVGGRDKIIWAAKKYKVDEIIFAIPSADSDTRNEVFGICMKTSCVIKTLPSYYQVFSGQLTKSIIRRVDIADLLERPQVDFELENVTDFIKGKKILITGAGGSIGSELCRQLAKFEPEELIAFDIYENSIFFLLNELKDSFPNLNIIVQIGSVCDEDRVGCLFSTYRPDIVFHAAAHKHVPLMEDSPNEAVKNNVFGTLNTVIASNKYNVSRFVLISTDKAVNPTSVMGATKRICEMVIQYYDKISNTEFVAVRFGNVLGSNGSVIPIFKKQIEEGGPVRVTHPDIIRYFMTISEAISLVLQAGAYAKGGEIFILDMGEPVKILSLAENMVRLSGHVPYKDIAIEFSGLRPGEKIYEELLMGEEKISGTKNKKIFIGKPIELDEKKFLAQLESLRIAANNESSDIRFLLREIVTTYQYNV